MPARPEAGDEEMEGILYLLQEFKGKVVLFGISDVVDIAIMAFLIYKVIMLMLSLIHISEPTRRS